MIKGKSKQKVYFSLCNIISIFNKFIPKSKNKILFFSSNTISDNSKALLDYMLDNNFNKNYKIVCSAKSHHDYLKDKNNIVLSTPIKGIFHILTSKYIFFHGEIIAIKPSKNQVSINLWHGTPLKKFNKLADKLSDYKYNFFTYLLASSEYFKPVMKECFDCNINQVKVLGHPRNDLLFKKSDILASLGISRKNYNKIFLWMPTFRVSKDKYIVDIDDSLRTETGLPIFSTENDLIELNNFLVSVNGIIIIKLHPAQNLDFINIASLSNIKFLMNSDIEYNNYHLYNLVAQCDSLITDYSSIYFDYLLLDRPIGFTIDDIESYRRNRGFIIDNPESLMPGMKIRNIQDFKDFISNTINNIDTYSDERKKINDLANKYQDDNNCKRIIELVKLK